RGLGAGSCGTISTQQTSIAFSLSPRTLRTRRNRQLLYQRASSCTPFVRRARTTRVHSFCCHARRRSLPPSLAAPLSLGGSGVRSHKRVRKAPRAREQLRPNIQTLPEKRAACAQLWRVYQRWQWAVVAPEQSTETS